MHLASCDADVVAAPRQERPETVRPLPPLDHYVDIGARRGIAWSPLRLGVLELLWDEPRPRGPYEIAYQASVHGTRTYPNTIYRVLRCLAGVGLIIPIVTLRRYQISPDPLRTNWAVLICGSCKDRRLVPMDAEMRQLRETALAASFQPSELTIECVGRCTSCEAASVSSSRDSQLLEEDH